MTTTVWGSTKKPVASQRLAKQIERSFPNEGILYVGYPVLSGPDGSSSIDALWISPAHGIVIFQLVEGRDAFGYPEAQDEYANSLETRLRPHKLLMSGRTLLAVPAVVTYAPALRGAAEIEGYPLVDDDSLIEKLEALTWDRPDLYSAALSVIQSISSIRKSRKRRSVTRADSRGARLKELEDSIANLDSLQSRAVIETVDGVQRIRGLAGSGKTIILALKAAYLHAQHPEWKIAVTFNTRSLKGQFVRLIETFVLDQTGEQPDWDQIQVLNAWGAPGGSSRTGVYYQFCQENGVEFSDFQSARAKYPRGSEFDGACSAALSNTKSNKQLFDAILIDEAQDFDASFLSLCYASLGEVKRLVYAYDELQTLTDTSLPPPEELFGAKADGSPNVRFDPPTPGRPKQDIILEKCYRNSGPVLATAHALGFGIYREPDPKTGTGLIQMFERAELWEDVGYSVVGGELKDDQMVRLARTPASSPEFLEAPAAVDQLVEFIAFNSAIDQASWLSEQVQKNVEEDELNYNDIIVINPDPLTTVKEAGAPRRLLFEAGIPSHVAGVDTSSDIFFKPDEDSIAFTGIFRAKGNEAGMVYVMNAHTCFSSYGSIGKIRNQLFTAITRSKAWVKVLGIGPDMVKLQAEYERVVDHQYTLEFVYPDAGTRRKLKVLNRELSRDEQRRIKGTESQMRQLTQDIAARNVLIDDLPKELVESLARLLQDRLHDDQA